MAIAVVIDIARSGLRLGAELNRVLRSRRRLRPGLRLTLDGVGSYRT
ncbi:MAG TPA: hypothetical protein VK789_03880 [Bryobacteraceae bacterium]|nr:hypothetical protein [Bryobacteraceae bacterium]